MEHHGDSESSSGPSDHESESESELGECSSVHRSAASGHGSGETSHIQTLEHSTELDSVHAAVSSGDFGQVVLLKAKRSLTDHEKFVLLTKHFVPPRSYKFPSRFVSGRNRHFQHSWLEQYNGLVYSESDDGGFCKCCVLFARAEPGKELGVLVNRPLIDYKRATEKLTDHFQGKKFHKAALQAAEAFTATMNNPDLAIDRRLSSERSKRAAENRLKLSSIAETVLFCGRQGLAFRGHRDDGPSIEENPHANHGNFLALLQFRVQAGDHVLEEHLKTAPGNALYTSKTVQNQMIAIPGDNIRRKLLEMVQKAGFFSVIADEATDTVNDEQLSICVRFLDGGLPHEKFLAFHECQSGVTGEALADDILSKLAEWQLQLFSTSLLVDGERLT